MIFFYICKIAARESSRQLANLQTTNQIPTPTAGRFTILSEYGHREIVILPNVHTLYCALITAHADHALE